MATQELSRHQRYTRRQRLEAEIRRLRNAVNEYSQDIDSALSLVQSHGTVWGEEWQRTQRQRIAEKRAVRNGDREVIAELKAELDALGGPIRRRK